MKNLKIESILEGIVVKSNELNIDISIESMFPDDDYRQHNTYIVENMETNVFGVITSCLDGYDPDDIHFFGFDPKMYTYSKAEGFSKEEGFKAFGDKILIKLDCEKFIDFIFNKEGYCNGD